tara:strand:+ start:106 stop:900 length:795 start_codon:yes stop_codon:yes gene_type:complete
LELLFEHPQPRGGKTYNKKLEQIFVSAIPNTINSDDTNSVLYKLINDTLKFIEIRNKQKIFELELHFFNSATIIEEFIIEGIIDSFLQNAFDYKVSSQSRILEKENIIFFNEKIKEGGREVYKIPLIIEKNRSDNDFKFFIGPFIWSILSSSDDKKFEQLKKQLNITEYSSETLVANPSYMSLRNHLKNTPPLFEFSSIELLVSSFFEILKEREGSNKKKYKDFEGFINYEEIETSIIFSKNKNDFTKQAFENMRPIMERLDKK